MGKKIGKQTLEFTYPPYVINGYSVVGPQESEGPLKDYFDNKIIDYYYGEKTWEKAERKMMEEAAQNVIKNSQLKPDNIDFLLAGDLLNQTISANFAARTLGIPFFGLYGACSTMFESIILGSVLIDGGFATYVVAATSSHYGTAERQFRMPTEHGNQRPLTAQWTVTGAGATLIGKKSSNIKITHATVGKVLDMGIKDANNMGAAMAPAAADTIVQHFKDTGRKPSDYDLIFSGDLGKVGKKITEELVLEAGYDIRKNFNDCGLMIYDLDKQDKHAGGSGCACSATVFNGFILKEMKKRNLRRIFGITTGALLSTCSIQQGESIPGIAQGVVFEYSGEENIA